MNEIKDNINRYLTIKQFATKFASFSESTLRNLLFKKTDPGFNKCIKRLGGKIYIDTKTFFEWIDSQNN